MEHSADAGITVAVIVPTYNRADLLKQTLESLLRQSRQVNEIIVSDDGSTDHTSAVLKTFASHITVITQAHAGRSQVRNAGLRAAQSDLVAFLDDDDILPPESIEKRVSFLIDHPTVDVVYSDALAIDSAGNILGRYKRVNRAKSSGNVFKDILFQNLAPIHAYMFRRACLEKTGLFDPNLNTAEDWDFWIRMAEHYRFAYLKAPLAYYRFHPGMSSQHTREQLAANGLAVQERAFATPAFKALAPREQAQLYFRHATWRIRINELATARDYYRRALQAAPLYLPAYSLLIAVSVLQRFSPNALNSRFARKLFQMRSLFR